MDTQTPKMVSPAVITSKLATNHLNEIKMKHSDIVQGIADQSVRVANYNAQINAEKKAREDQMKAESIQNEKARVESETKRMEAENKRRELDIKQQALSL